MPGIPQTQGVAAAAILSLASLAAGQEGWQGLRLHRPEWQESQVFAGAAGQFGGYALTGLPNEQFMATLWDANTGADTFLAPAARIHGMAPGTQVGTHVLDAAVWQGTPGLPTNLNPVGARGSNAWGAAIGSQVGNVYFGTSPHPAAAVWHGSAGSVTVLHPAGAVQSTAYATDGTRQGGFVDFGPAGFYKPRAALWEGSAGSFTDLNPGPGYTSEIRGMVPGQQVGQARLPGSNSPHASLWSGISETWRDLHPFPSFGESTLFATTGSAQIGFTTMPSNTFGVAGVWFGSAESFINLHPFLPPGYRSSVAYAAFEASGLLHVGGVAFTTTGRREAVMWVGPIPAPGTAAALLGASVLAARRRRRESGRYPLIVI